MRRAGPVEQDEFFFGGIIAMSVQISISNEIPAVRMKSVKIWLAITWRNFSPVSRDLGNNRPGSRQTGLIIFHIIAQQGWPGLAVAGIIKLFVHSFL